ncbi:MAG: hypothetical protein ACLGHY_06555 [Gammaproteobacteria bacterium]
MAKPNYAFAKRQRDLAKKQKKEEKLKRKAEAPATPPTDTPDDGAGTASSPGVEGVENPQRES